jgi:hypothetical protein
VALNGIITTSMVSLSYTFALDAGGAGDFFCSNNEIQIAIPVPAGFFRVNLNTSII